jgi:hypothetical protein
MCVATPLFPHTRLHGVVFKETHEQASERNVVSGRQLTGTVNTTAVQDRTHTASYPTALTFSATGRVFVSFQHIQILIQLIENQIGYQNLPLLSCNVKTLRYPRLYTSVFTHRFFLYRFRVPVSTRRPTCVLLQDLLPHSQRSARLRSTPVRTLCSALHQNETLLGFCLRFHFNTTEEEPDAIPLHCDTCPLP